MSSLKRYRQASDSNAAARFRDLPPRFKRQKSVPSHDSDTADSHKQQSQQNQKPKKMTQGFPVTDGIGNTKQFNLEVAKQSEVTKDKKLMKKGAGTRPHLIVDQNSVKKLTQPIVLSPMDSNLFNLAENDEQECSTTFNMNPFSWQSQQQSPWHEYDYEQKVISETKPMIPNGNWSSPPVSNLQQPKMSPHSHFNQVASSTAGNPYPNVATELPKDYSENDRRIIEMFKELERVADEKEKEERESGTQGKAPVSHHLRMLMCAMDKYTEGIDDEEDYSGRVDEAPTEERSISPSSTQENVRLASPSQATLQPPQLSNACTQVTTTTGGQRVHVAPMPMQSPQSMHALIQGNVMYQQVPSCAPIFSQGYPREFFSKGKPPLSFASADVQPWNLWSGPSINTLDVYSNLPKGHNSFETADSTFALFDQLGMGNDYNYDSRAEEFSRTPLYRR